MQVMLVSQVIQRFLSAFRHGWVQRAASPLFRLGPLFSGARPPCSGG